MQQLSDHIEHTREWFEANRTRIIDEIGVYECMNCGNEDNLHLHHVVPLTTGGSNWLSNIRVLCNRCHALAHKASEVVSWNLVANVPTGRYSDQLTKENLIKWRRDNRKGNARQWFNGRD